MTIPAIPQNLRIATEAKKIAAVGQQIAEAIRSVPGKAKATKRKKLAAKLRRKG